MTVISLEDYIQTLKYRKPDTAVPLWLDVVNGKERNCWEEIWALSNKLMSILSELRNG